MKEIGSEFWDVPVTQQENNIFPEFTQWFLSGRAALKAIIRELKGHSVEMPSWCCDSMVTPFAEAGIDIHYYPVYFRDGLVREIKLNCEILFLMDYFGYTNNDVPDLSNYKGIVIRDVTHSIFSTSFADADYCFGSLRKWCGVWTGGYAWNKCGSQLHAEGSDGTGFIRLREKAMNLKMKYISEYTDNRMNCAAEKQHLIFYELAEEALEDTGIAPAAMRDIALAKRLDANFIKFRHRANAEVLRAAFPEWLMFPELKDRDCPMFVPILVPDGKRDKLRSYLIKNSIYCPIHWPVKDTQRLDHRTARIYNNELSLVCDQRYTQNDMQKMAELISSSRKEI